MEQVPRQFLRQAKVVSNGGYKRTCAYCGSSTVGALPGETACNVCEAYLTGPEPGSPPVVTREISAKALHGDVTELDTLAAELQKKGASSPLALYGISALYSAASGYAYRNLDYARSGFMEENSDTIYSSLKLATKSKECIYKTLAMISAIPDASSDSQLMYFAVLSNVHLNRLTEAKRALDALNNLKKGGFIQAYPNLVYAVSAKTPGVMQQAHPLLNTGEPNAFYYLARHLAQNKQMDDAISVLEELTGTITMPMAAFMLSDLKSLKEKTSL